MEIILIHKEDSKCLKRQTQSVWKLKEGNYFWSRNRIFFFFFNEDLESDAYV